ncbi:PspC domain-containing protein [Virgibacillus ndiopensis]|uniref:PspC domain-containing protein n=1 Tax=Virgibacillus ndiopensis TaxID=2004408 RepID=UPI003CCBDAD1
MSRLMKSSTDKALFGVCAGFAEFFRIEPIIVRLIFIFLPVSIFAYLILAALLPKNPSLY